VYIYKLPNTSNMLCVSCMEFEVVMNLRLLQT